MKKKTKKDFEAYIFGVIKKYVPVLFLQRHTFELSGNIGNKGALFEFKFAYPYLNSTVCYSDGAFDRWTQREDMRPFIVHELCHAITDPLYCKAISRCVSEGEISNERELLTDYICNIVLGQADRKKERR